MTEEMRLLKIAEDALREDPTITDTKHVVPTLRKLETPQGSQLVITLHGVVPFPSDIDKANAAVERMLPTAEIENRLVPQ